MYKIYFKANDYLKPSAKPSGREITYVVHGDVHSEYAHTQATNEETMIQIEQLPKDWDGVLKNWIVVKGELVKIEAQKNDS